ncbi:MAG TPA: formate dehydrogenase subunit delta [Caulobacteraceae bacterium]|jgi:formate dehydrogenase subunit delta|nr:formate dehydrogenase subunit delta [Caulobacteraceae bacterium]
MSASTSEHLVRMANQVASFFVTQPGDTAALRTADHINAYWVVKMKRDLIDYVDHGGGGLTPAALEAVHIVKNRTSKVVERALARAGEGSPGHQAGDDAG